MDGTDMIRGLEFRFMMRMVSCLGITFFQCGCWSDVMWMENCIYTIL